jgi:glycosyltransferase involved in cell wall biosynthesis
MTVTTLAPVHLARASQRLPSVVKAVTPHRLLVLADKVGATQYISFAHPLQGSVAEDQVSLWLASDEGRWSTEAERRAFWSRHRPTTLVLSRYSEPHALEFIKLARESGVPTIFHIDDDLLAVPMALGASKYDHYNHPPRLAVLRTALDASDLVYASTPSLAGRLVAHGVRAPVVSGHVYCSIDPDRVRPTLPTSGPVIGYMGTGGHSRDLAMIAPVLTKLMRQIPALRFETFGTVKPPPEMKSFGARYAHHPGVADYAAFAEKLRELGWWIGLAPLEDNEFNGCKADTKWVEYSFAGMAVVASDLPMYRSACADNCGFVARSAEQWQQAVSRLIAEASLRRELVTRAQQKLCDGYTRAVLLRQLLDIVDRAHGLAQTR